MLKDRKVLVTGGTGFIGGRVVEKLVLEEDASVRVLVRNLSRAARIARFPVDIVRGGIQDPDPVQQAVDGCDVVIHCANDGDPEANVAGARSLAESCLRSGVRRMVHVSSMAVYMPFRDGKLDETVPASGGDWGYARNKLAVEKELLLHAESGLPLTVLQPTIVYGPFSAWTGMAVEAVRTGRLVLPDDGGGLCNAVYVDDAVQGIIRAASSDLAHGSRFLISGDNPITWREFFGAFEEMLGIKSVVCLPSDEIEAYLGQRSAAANVKMMSRDPGRSFGWISRDLKKRLRSMVGEGAWKRAKGTLPPPLHMPDIHTLRLYRARTEVVIEAARRSLNFNPRFSFQQGMQLTRQFVSWANL